MHHSSTPTRLITSSKYRKNKNNHFYSQNGRFYSRHLSWVEGEMMVKLHAHRHMPMQHADALRKDALLFAEKAGDKT